MFFGVTRRIKSFFCFGTDLMAGLIADLIVALVGVGSVLALAGVLGGCAYHGGFGNRGMPGGYTLIAVPTFKNITFEAGTEVYFTNAIIRELNRSHVARIVDKSEAQATLEGVVEKIAYTATSQKVGKEGEALPKGTALTDVNRVYVASRVTLRRNSDQTVLWTQVFTSERVYLPPLIGRPGLNSVNAPYDHSARYQAVAAVAIDMMSEAHDRLTENFW